jgi:DNA repair protein RecN (Recombination protein N)
MLVELTIRDLALFEEATLELGDGLNAVTGETGAGKSLIVGALELLLGETPRGGAAQWVRKGARQARVEGRFVLAGPTLERVRAHLAAELPEIAAGSGGPAQPELGEVELILGRTLTAEGRTSAHVEQRPVPLRALRALAPLVLEIHGQNDHQRLLDPAEQLVLLDAFGECGAALADYRTLRAQWRDACERLERLESEREERRDRLDRLRFQAAELERARLEPGEGACLREERALLRSAEGLVVELGAVASELVEGENPLADRLERSARVVARWSKELARLEGAHQDLEAAVIHAREAGSALAGFLGGVQADPTRLEAVEERLAELERLEHKYGTDEAGLLARASAIGAEIEALDGAEESGAALRTRCVQAHAALERAARALAERRRALAPTLAERVQGTLAELGLARARFEVVQRERADEHFGPDGADEVEFHLAANPGEACRPLRHVASGGEAARIMLALRTVLSAGGRERAARDRGRTLVFDEIDSGVGGRLGPEVGRHLRELARGAQVVCVTHLPAIAALAHLHMHVTKVMRDGRTRVIANALAGEARVAEVADMIAGGADEATARAEARRLLELASGR